MEKEKSGRVRYQLEYLLKKEGFEIHELKVGRNCQVNPKDLKKLLTQIAKVSK